MRINKKWLATTWTRLWNSIFILLRCVLFAWGSVYSYLPPLTPGHRGGRPQLWARRCGSLEVDTSPAWWSYRAASSPVDWLATNWGKERQTGRSFKSQVQNTLHQHKEHPQVSVWESTLSCNWLWTISNIAAFGVTHSLAFLTEQTAKSFQIDL